MAQIGVCPACALEIVLRADGKLRLHRDRDGYWCDERIVDKGEKRIAQSPTPTSVTRVSASEYRQWKKQRSRTRYRIYRETRYR